MSDSDAEVGPMPAGAPVRAHDDGADAFREREVRMRAAQADAAAAAAAQKSERPAWMVEMPDDAGPPAWRPGAGPLRPRGFHQGGRVQRHGGAGGETSEHARRLWTETPEQRAQRILRGGDDAAADAAADEDARERLAREQAAKRDAEIRAQIEQMHRQKQIDEVKRRRAERDGAERGERGERGEPGESGESGEGKWSEGRAREWRGSEKDRERSEGRERARSERHERERAERHARHERERAERHERHERERAERHERHRRERHERERERSERHRDDRHRDERSERHRSERHRHRRRSASPPRRKTRAEREAEDLAHPPTPLFDKDKVLGAGARMMDERARARTVADAAELGARFANGARGAFL
ncbi:hypothetical protein CBS14141_004341 [Malassezia furfur]|nr:hypothetical protein CBS14141_004341 [Malassezia furfur]